jgi:large subunit ribosomal protein L14
MIQLRTVLKPADNSGAKRLKLVHIHKGSKRKFATIGDIITCVVDEADNNGQVKDSQVVKAVVVRVRKEYRRRDGSYIRFDDNAAVVINGLTNFDPIGTRIFGPIAREIKELGFAKIASLATEVL